MPRAKIINNVLARLMGAYHNCHPYDPEKATPSTAICYSSTGNQFALVDAWPTTLRQVTSECNDWLDQYPLRGFERFLMTAIADEKEAARELAETSVILRQKVEGFFDAINQSPEWEVINAVYGLAVTQPPFDLGPCRFFIMRESELECWAQRRRCGNYDPPPDTIPRAFAFGESQTAGLDRQLLGNWVASLRLNATDANHAITKAKYRLEEVLNVLRHASFFLALPEQCVRAGVGHPSYWNSHSMCVRVHPPGGFQDSVGNGGEGLIIQTHCLASNAWHALQTLVAKEAGLRSNLEATVMTAVTWVGQAATALLGPVRLAALMTAMEVLVLLESESLGKRSKLSTRVARIVQTEQPELEQVQDTVVRLYRLRSQCLHRGAIQVQDDDIKTAYRFVDTIITVFLTKEPFCKCADLGHALAKIADPDEEIDYSI